MYLYVNTKSVQGQNDDNCRLRWSAKLLKKIQPIWETCWCMRICQGSPPLQSGSVSINHITHYSQWSTHLYLTWRNHSRSSWSAQRLLWWRWITLGALQLVVFITHLVKLAISFKEAHLDAWIQCWLTRVTLFGPIYVFVFCFQADTKAHCLRESK
jgi:hypothetical protein